MMPTRLVASLLALSLIAAACGSTAESTTSTSTPGPTTPVTTGPGARAETFSPGEVAEVSLSKVDPVVNGADVAAVVAGDSEFGLNLFEVVAEDENLMISPYSIATALSMAYPGARGTTAEEIAAVLNLAVDDSTLHAVRNYIDTVLATEAPPPSDEDTRQPFTIRPANSAWGQGGYPFNEDYLRTLAENYGAGIRLLDYATDPDGSRVIINDWVEEATEDRIRDLLPDGSIDPMTRLVLVNAIWFKANWFEQFPEQATALGEFTLLNGSTVDTPLMRTSLPTQYADTDLFEAVRLPYAGDAAMVVLLPKNGTPAELAASLEAADLQIPWSGHDVNVTMPSFEFEGDVALKDALQELGMRAAFVPPVPGNDNTADLTGIVDVRELYISDAFHKTFIALDEEGTEAAAATALVARATSGSPVPPVEFTADRPFLFWIEHGSTGAMLFLGQVTNPAV